LDGRKPLRFEWLLPVLYAVTWLLIEYVPIFLTNESNAWVRITWYVVIFFSQSAFIGASYFRSASLFRRTRRRWERVEIVSFFFLLAAFISPVLLALSTFVLNALAWLQTPSALSAVKIPSVVAATAFSATLLFWLRLKFRMIYGITEARLGLVVAYRLGSAATEVVPLRDPSFLIGFLTASVYLVVRGLDNVH
jgi:hypothetical protein